MYWFNNDFIFHINMTFYSLISTSTHASTLLFALARSFSRQAIACPSTSLNTSKPFPRYLQSIKPSSHILLRTNNKHTINVISFVLLSYTWTRLFPFYILINSINKPHKHWQPTIRMNAISLICSCKLYGWDQSICKPSCLIYLITHLLNDSYSS
jgi:hypothetical protein